MRDSGRHYPYNWEDNFSSLSKTVTLEGREEEVHTGFFDAATSSLEHPEGILVQLEKLQKKLGIKYADTPIVCSGHSRGGPIAQIVAGQLRSEQRVENPVNALVFSSAKWKKREEIDVAQRDLSVAMQGDPVTYIPLGSIDAGNMNKIKDAINRINIEELHAEIKDGEINFAGLKNLMLGQAVFSDFYRKYFSKVTNQIEEILFTPLREMLKRPEFQDLKNRLLTKETMKEALLEVIQRLTGYKSTVPLKVVKSSEALKKKWQENHAKMIERFNSLQGQESPTFTQYARNVEVFKHFLSLFKFSLVAHLHAGDVHDVEVKREDGTSYHVYGGVYSPDVLPTYEELQAIEANWTENSRFFNDMLKKVFDAHNSNDNARPRLLEGPPERPSTPEAVASDSYLNQLWHLWDNGNVITAGIVRAAANPLLVVNAVFPAIGAAVWRGAGGGAQSKVLAAVVRNAVLESELDAVLEVLPSILTKNFEFPFDLTQIIRDFRDSPLAKDIIEILQGIFKQMNTSFPAGGPENIPRLSKFIEALSSPPVFNDIRPEGNSALEVFTYKYFYGFNISDLVIEFDSTKEITRERKVKLDDLGEKFVEDLDLDKLKDGLREIFEADFPAQADYDNFSRYFKRRVPPNKE